MHMSREDYINGYISGMIGYNDNWSREDVEIVLGKVLKESAHEKWWNTPIPKWGMVEPVTPNEMWQRGAWGQTNVADLVLSYLETSFS
jgi:hypothetical protein